VKSKEEIAEEIVSLYEINFPYSKRISLVLHFASGLADEKNWKQQRAKENHLGKLYFK